MEGRIAQIILNLPILVAEDWHTTVRKILQRFEEQVESLGQALGLGRVHNGFERLDDLNLLVSSLAITLHSIQNDEWCFAKRIKRDALTNSTLLALELFFDRLTRVIPVGLLLLILLKQSSALLLNLLLHLLLHGERVVKALALTCLFRQKLLELLQFGSVGSLLLRHLILDLVQLALILKITLM